MSKNLIVKDNALINASYNLELVEQRLILLAIVQARKENKTISTDSKVTINVSDYVEEFGVVKSGSLYQNLKNACNTLFDRKFSYTEMTDKGEKVSKSRWVSKVSYIEESAIIEIFFTPDIVRFITLLEKHFTSYELEQVADLKSKYAVRMYEMLIAWRSQGKTPILNIDTIRKRLGVLETEYKIMGDFKKRVLDLSIKEINEKTDIKATYEQHKQGKKIIGFTFKFQQTKKKKSEKENRDENTGDMFATLKMTDKQRSFFASKLSELHECSQLPYGNQSYEALAKWIEKDLLKPERIEFYRPLLKKVGFSE